MMLLGELLPELPEELAPQVFPHASWSERPSDSYTRLAFLGDSVLALAVTAYLYPLLEADRFGAGRLTKIRAQAVYTRAGASPSRECPAARSQSAWRSPSGCVRQRPPACARVPLRSWRPS